MLPLSRVCIEFSLEFLPRYDYKTQLISEDVAAQAEQAMQNINDALVQAGAQMADIVRVRYILPSRSDFPKIWHVLQRWFRHVRPAATMIQAGLMEEVMKIEIEVTAHTNHSVRCPATEAHFASQTENLLHPLHP